VSESEPTGHDRDFVGYGRNAPQVQWPDGARLAISLVINYETGAEYSHPDGDARNEAIGELPGWPDQSQRNLQVESVYEYDSRAGTYRLLRMFDRYGVKCTFFAAARALERNPEVCAWIRGAGHEACSHGWRWNDEDPTTSREEEGKRIRLAIDSITKTCGERPVGWFSRRESVNTRELLVEEGGFLYDSNAYNDDLPYYVNVSGKPFLVIPYSLVYNDAKFFFGGFSSPSDFVDYCCRAIDYLSEEGSSHPSILTLGLHGRWMGQAGRASALREVIEHGLAKRAWFPRRVDIAKTWMEQFPPLATRR
jgi:peptidoglycan/xylan/chitin deacetylase (PgdA/CDA1 family)